MNKLLKKISPRTIYVSMAAVVLLTCLAFYLYLFKEPVKDYALMKSDRELLQAKVESGSDLSRNLDIINNEVDFLTRRLQGETPQFSVSKMVAHVINRLDAISSGYQVTLVSIRPDTPDRIMYFEEIPFSIEVSGSYFKLYDWLQEVERELGPMVVKKFEITPQGRSKEMSMRLNMVSYRSIQ